MPLQAFAVIFLSSLLPPATSGLLVDKLLQLPIDIFSTLIHNLPSSLHPSHIRSQLSTTLIDYSILSLLCIPLFLVLKCLYRFLFEPFNRVRLLGEVGYGSDGKQAAGKALTVATLMRRRRTGKVPPVYPNGWFAIIESRDLPVKSSKHVFCLGLNLAVYRGEDGKARVVQAYCPHNGANLGVGGVVKGNCLECPFHGWRFQGDGKCVHIPYTEQKYIPENATLKTYETLEQNGSVLVWYHAEGDSPSWLPPEISEIQQNVWKYAGRSEHIINAHIQEIPENGADLAHLGQVHGPVMLAGSDLSETQNSWWDFSHHHWEAGWQASAKAGEKHVGRMDLLHHLVVAGRFVSLLDLKIIALQIGPGIVHLSFESALIGQGAYIQTLTPIEPLVQRVVHHIYVHKLVPNILAKFFLFGEALMIERDMMIWNNKMYVSKPVYVKSKEDSLVAKHRRWYSQFYSDHSPRLDTDLMVLSDW